MCDDHCGSGSHEVSRRAVLAGAAGVAVAGAIGLPALTRSRAAVASEHATGFDGKDPVSMAMHIHASFSEYWGSYEAQLDQARQHNVDVIWWTDHDFRTAAHGHLKAIRFDGFTEPDAFSGSWTWVRTAEGNIAWEQAEFVSTPTSPDETGNAMRLGVRTGGSSATLQYRLAAQGSGGRYSVSLADTTLELDVLCEQTGPGREVLVHIESSRHPARASIPEGRLRVTYRIGGVSQVNRFREGNGLFGVVELPAPAGQWHRLQLRPVDDIALLWPDHVAEDNSLWELYVGVRSQSSSTDTRAVVDRLRIDRGAAEGALWTCDMQEPVCPTANHSPAIDLRRSVIQQYAAEYPDVTHYESWEVSLGRHINWIGPNLDMPPLTLPPTRRNPPEVSVELIDFIHARGALAQWCHPLDVHGSPGSLVQEMIEWNNLGADIVEIGRNPLNSLFDAFDGAARNAVLFTAVGVSDDHGGWSWPDLANNHISYVWASSTGMNDLLDGLRAGRAWFGNLARWRGELDIAAWGVAAMGGVAVTSDQTVPVELLATNLPAGSTLEIVTGAVDYAATTQNRQIQTVTPGQLVNDRFQLTVSPGSTGIFLRTQIRGSDNLILASSNPVWLLRDPPPNGIPPARVLQPGSSSPTPGTPAQHPVTGLDFGTQQAPHPAANAIDGSPSSRWASWDGLPGAWIQFDLGQSRQVDQVRLQMYKGDTRTYPLQVSAGTSPGSLSPVWTGTTTMTAGLQPLTFAPVSARYVRVALTGAHSNGASVNSIHQAEVWGTS